VINMILRLNRTCKICGYNGPPPNRKAKLNLGQWYRNTFTSGNGWLCRTCYNALATGCTLTTMDFTITNQSNVSLFTGVIN
jgi:hypothetical protein